jgi:hypothetical protein
MGTADFTGVVSGPEQVEFSVTVHGNSAQVSGVCIAGGGIVTATGVGNSASWTGAVACPEGVVNTCSADGILTYSSLTLSLSDTTLTTTAAGIYETTTVGCDYGGALSVSFVAQKAP